MERKMTSPTEFDVVRVSPHVDLVLFDNIISCYQSDRPITANYVIGEEVIRSGWDWVGVFPVGWNSLGDYLVYTWAQPLGLDCTEPRRRTVFIPAQMHQIRSNPRDVYKLLYVSRGGNVLGASHAFHVFDEQEMHEYNIDRLFFNTCHDPAVSSTRQLPLSGGKRKSKKAYSPESDSYELVNELTCPVPCKRRKEKILTVFRDDETLVNIPSFTEWAEKLRFINYQSIVQEYCNNVTTPILSSSHTPPTSLTSPSSSLAVIPYHSRDVMPVYNIRWSTPSETSCSRFTPSIEYPELPSLMAGPSSFLDSKFDLKCINCQIARTLVRDLVEKDALHTATIERLQAKLQRLTAANRTKRERQHQTVNLIDWALEQVQNDNRKLRGQIDFLQERVYELTAARETESPALMPASPVEQTTDEEPVHGTWLLREPKRLARWKRVVVRQSRAVQTLRQSNVTYRKQLQQLHAENARLRSLISATFETSHRFRELSEQLNQQFRCVLAERNKGHDNEWLLRARSSQETTTQTQKVSFATSGTLTDPSATVSDGDAPIPTTSSTSATTEQTSACSTGTTDASATPKDLPRCHHVKNKQISKLLKKERTKVDVCFSRKTDPRHVKEHTVVNKNRCDKGTKQE
ncbi:uncharacterized protein LOC127859930 [Dreissena polymorpha]|uniref:uncharacterized protein LOC127859930 n=1 Tax=Dreissena polymorpha TaxID=45954 RepID=UPI0022649B37|nr:uncharacterized protein LOC127859930 [Dreissena polymorpha]